MRSILSIESTIDKNSFFGLTSDVLGNRRRCLIGTLFVQTRVEESPDRIESDGACLDLLTGQRELGTHVVLGVAPQQRCDEPGACIESYKGFIIKG